MAEGDRLAVVTGASSGIGFELDKKKVVVGSGMTKATGAAGSVLPNRIKAAAVLP